MDKYYVCRDYNGAFHKIKVMDDYYDAVIAAASYAKGRGWDVVVIHHARIIHRAKP